MFFIYQIFISLIVLFSPIIIIVRLIKRKEHKLRFIEKFCFFTKKKNQKEILFGYMLQV